MRPRHRTRIPPLLLHFYCILLVTFHSSGFFSVDREVTGQQEFIHELRLKNPHNLTLLDLLLEFHVVRYIRRKLSGCLRRENERKHTREESHTTVSHLTLPPII